MAVKVETHHASETPAARHSHGIKTKVIVAAMFVACVVVGLVLTFTLTGSNTHVPAPDGRTAALERLHQDAATAPGADPVTSALQRMHADAAKP